MYVTSLFLNWNVKKTTKLLEQICLWSAYFSKNLFRKKGLNKDWIFFWKPMNKLSATCIRVYVYFVCSDCYMYNLKWLLIFCNGPSCFIVLFLLSSDCQNLLFQSVQILKQLWNVKKRTSFSEGKRTFTSINICLTRNVDSEI